MELHRIGFTVWVGLILLGCGAAAVGTLYRDSAQNVSLRLVDDNNYEFTRGTVMETGKYEKGQEVSSGLQIFSFTPASGAIYVCEILEETDDLLALTCPEGTYGLTRSVKMP